MAQNGIIKIAVLGAESTGKSWLCEALARHYHTVWVPEYAREYFNDSDIYNYTLGDLVTIAAKQIANEQQLIKSAGKFLFCDTTLVTLKIWAELEFQYTPPFIEDNLPEITYDHYLIMDNAMPWEEDPLRQNKFNRDMLQHLNIFEVEQLQAPYSIITGHNEERLKNAIRIVESLFGL